jgi:PiT family inorganic phosphate transporter
MWGWLSSGLLLGWSIGANVLANVFATAIASHMVRFATAVKLCVIFVILGGLINGPAGMETFGDFGGVDTLAGAFAVALASALAVTCMVGAGLPVSAAQTAVGALIGYRLFRDGSVGASAQLLLRMIITTWLCVPILAAGTAFLIYKAVAQISRRLPMPLFLLDQWLRLALLAAGCYAAWAVGGNNMANVVGFYMRLDLFPPLPIGSWIISQPRILAFLGGLAISVGVVTYSRRIMLTVGRDLVRLDAMTAFIAILAEALVVDFFAHSWRLYVFTLPAIPVSLSQALVGSIVGLGLARGIQTIQIRILRNIVIGWVTAPLISMALAYLLLPVVLRLG